jgi:hypothetical protein
MRGTGICTICATLQAGSGSFGSLSVTVVLTSLLTRLAAGLCVTTFVETGLRILESTNGPGLAFRAELSMNGAERLELVRA